MTREQAKELWPILKAWGDGKTIQFLTDGTMGWGWLDLTDLLDDCGRLDRYKLRIKPEPKLRPWRPEEVPIGKALIRSKGAGSTRHLIVAVWNEGTILAGQEFKCCAETAFRNYEQSTDNGKTWHPCGVEE